MKTQWGPCHRGIMSESNVSKSLSFAWSNTFCIVQIVISYVFANYIFVKNLHNKFIQYNGYIFYYVYWHILYPKNLCRMYMPTTFIMSLYNTLGIFLLSMLSKHILYLINLYTVIHLTRSFEVNISFVNLRTVNITFDGWLILMLTSTVFLFWVLLKYLHINKFTWARRS